MLSQRPYKTLQLFNLTKRLTLFCYELSADWKDSDYQNLKDYLRKSALTAHLSTAQGAFLKGGKKQRKFVQAAQHALIVIDAVNEVLVDLKLVNREQSLELEQISSEAYQMLEELLR